MLKERESEPSGLPASQTPSGWPEIRAWRRNKRAELIAARVRMLRRDREVRSSAIIDRLRAGLPSLAGEAAGFYWAFKGEIDLRGVVRDLVGRGSQAALPVVVEKGRPLEFWSWRPRMKMDRGIWNIPIPGERVVVQPRLLLVPLVGFDAAGYRLGYGGGYYDRTLAAMQPRPLAIGVGFGLGRLSSIMPQPHDIPMDAIVTEDVFLWCGRAAAHV